MSNTISIYISISTHGQIYTLGQYPLNLQNLPRNQWLCQWQVQSIYVPSLYLDAIKFINDVLCNRLHAVNENMVPRLFSRPEPVLPSFRTLSMSQPCVPLELRPALEHCPLMKRARYASRSSNCTRDTAWLRFFLVACVTSFQLVSEQGIRRPAECSGEYQAISSALGETLPYIRFEQRSRDGRGVAN
jgi:hypothetical protein